jgi:hypothetical protein
MMLNCPHCRDTFHLPPDYPMPEPAVMAFSFLTCPTCGGKSLWTTFSQTRQLAPVPEPDPPRLCPSPGIHAGRDSDPAPPAAPTPPSLLSPCPACTHPCSSAAAYCPACGHPLRTPISEGLSFLAITVSLILPPIGLMIFLSLVISADESRRRIAAQCLAYALGGSVPWLCLGLL